MRRRDVMHKCLMEQFEVKGVKLVSSVFQARRRRLKTSMSPNYQSVPPELAPDCAFCWCKGTVSSASARRWRGAKSRCWWSDGRSAG